MKVLPQHWPHLKQQHGRIGIYKDDFDEWCWHYEESLNKIYDNIAPYLPVNFINVLDIGGGFSGISTKLPGSFSLTVIDGLDDKPKRVGTSNSQLLAKEFLGLNGVFDVDYVSPEKSHTIFKKFDLIYSFAAYPFHIPTDKYEKNLVRNSHISTVFILEVRRGWNIPLKKIKTIYEEEKYERILAKRY